MSGSMSSSANSNAAAAAVVEEIDRNFPLWKYVTVIEKAGKKGGNVRWQCNYCNKIYLGSYSRVLAHLLKIKGQGVATCNSVTPEHKFEMDKLNLEAENLKKSKSVHIPFPPSVTGTPGIASSPGVPVTPFS